MPGKSFKSYSSAWNDGFLFPLSIFTIFYYFFGILWLLLFFKNDEYTADISRFKPLLVLDLCVKSIFSSRLPSVITVALIITSVKIFRFLRKITKNGGTKKL